MKQVIVLMAFVVVALAIFGGIISLDDAMEEANTAAGTNLAETEIDEYLTGGGTMSNNPMDWGWDTWNW